MNNLISKFCLNPHQTDSELQIYISSADEQLGRVLILGEIRKAGQYNKKILKHIIEQAKKNYFKSVTRDSEKALEDGLQKINFSLSETIRETKKEWLKSSNVIIAACRNREVHFAKIGHINTFLISNKDIVNITQGSSREDVNPVKAFANIYSGSLPKSSAILFLTDNILDYVSQEKLKRLVNQNTCQAAMLELKSMLKRAPTTQAFGALLIKRSGKGKHSANTAEPLAVTRASAATVPEEKKKVITNTLPSKPTRLFVPKRLARRLSYKILAASIIILLTIVLLFNLFFNKKSEQPETSAEVTQYQISLNNIQSKFIAAQDSLIIDDREQAQIFLQQAIGLIAELPAQTALQKAQKQSLNRKVATQLLLAQGVNLTAPQLLTESMTPGIDFTPRQLLLKEGSLYTFDEQNNGIYKLDLANSESAKLEISASQVGNLILAIDHTGAGIIFYHSLDGLAQLDLETNKLNSLEWNRTWQGKPRASDVYQNKLYLISSENKLLKYTRSITGFTQEVEWLKDESLVDLAGAVDMAIDGSIWILKKNGEIIKLFKGEQEDFVFDINPKLQGPTSLFTDMDVNYLYILDPPSKRIVVLNKSGKLINQFTAQEFTDIADFAVDEAARKIYLLDNGKVFEIRY
jgi:serine/threonine protein phosphatase PrpC